MAGNPSRTLRSRISRSTSSSGWKTFSAQRAKRGARRAELERRGAGSGILREREQGEHAQHGQEHARLAGQRPERARGVEVPQQRAEEQRDDEQRENARRPGPPLLGPERG